MKRQIKVNNSNFPFLAIEGYELPGYPSATLITFSDTRHDENVPLCAAVLLPRDVPSFQYESAWSAYPIATHDGEIEVTTGFFIHRGNKNLYAHITVLQNDGSSQFRIHVLGTYK